MIKFGKIQSVLLITLTVILVSDLFKTAHASEVSHSRNKYARQLLILCTANGLIPYPGDTTKYIQCVWIGPRWYYWVYNCPPGSGFDPARSLCVIGVTGAPTTTGGSSDSTPAGTTGAGGSTPPASGSTGAGGSSPAGSSDAGGSSAASSPAAPSSDSASSPAAPSSDSASSMGSSVAPPSSSEASASSSVSSP